MAHATNHYGVLRIPRELLECEEDDQEYQWFYESPSGRFMITSNQPAKQIATTEADNLD